jgi:Putative adhesin
MKTRFVRSIALAAMLAFASLVWAQAEQGTDNGREFHWTGKLSPDQVVVIKDINGDIDATGSSSSDQVEVTAVKSGRGAEDVKISVVKLSDGVEICAIYPGFFSSGGDCESGSHFGNNHNNAKVDFTVRMPRNLRFIAKNVNGGVNADSMGRYVEADSVNGTIKISTESWASASSVNGSIYAKIGRAEWTGNLEFKTVNGSIHLELPTNINTDIDFKSVNGHLDSDFPRTVQGEIGRHSIHATVGSGGRSLEIKTVNGDGELRKSSI